MATGSQQPTTVTEWVDLHRLAPPETDVRANRDRGQIRSIAQSLERSGQLQAAKVFPSNVDAVDADEISADELRETALEADELVVVDGWTRREAAKVNNWDSLRCEIFPSEPEDQTIESLDANTERLDMTDFETIKALRDWKDETGATDEQVAQKIGKARSTVSNYFRALDGYEPAVMAWKDPETIIEYGHVRELEQLPTDELKEKCLQDALEFERGVGAFRQTVNNTLEGWKRKQASQQTKAEAEDEGHSQKAAREEARTRQQNEPSMTCFFCGEPTDRQVAVPVCEEDSGMVYRKKESGEPLLASIADEDNAEAPADD